MANHARLGRQLQLAIGLVLCTIQSARATTFNITDTTFNLSDWQLTGIQGSNVTGATASVTGGLSGNARQITVNGTGSITYQVENYKTDQGFSPSLGLITEIDTQLWAYVTSDNRTFQNTKIIAKQASGFYVAPANWDPPIFSSSPQKFTANQSPANFNLFRGSGASTLDLSPSAPTIFFGYLSYSPVFIPSPATVRNTFDVVDIIYTPVPEPQAIGYIGMACLAVVIRYQHIFRYRS